ncbi:MFS transporter [Candidatus Parcubacteria bacterium]|nr:MFS transporter [Candidatus Parcubacteria bacterium]
MKINSTIKLLILSDIFVASGFGLINPILAVFIKDNLIGGTLFTAGIASSLFLITKSIVQLFFSKHVDENNDENDVKWLVVGTIIIASVPFIYIFSHHIYYIFLAQILYGIGSGIEYSTWIGLWSTHLDKNRESFEWSLYSTLTGLGMAISSTLGAGIAQVFGFNITFIITGIMSVFGCFTLLKLRSQIKHSQQKLINSDCHVNKSLHR